MNSKAEEDKGTGENILGIPSVVLMVVAIALLPICSFLLLYIPPRFREIFQVIIDPQTGKAMELPLFTSFFVDTPGYVFIVMILSACAFLVLKELFIKKPAIKIACNVAFIVIELLIPVFLTVAVFLPIKNISKTMQGTNVNKVKNIK